jgi:hypothetical protein
MSALEMLLHGLRREGSEKNERERESERERERESSKMCVNKKDKNLLLALKDIQSVEARRHVIDHLGKVPAKRLAAHLKGHLLQQPGYRVRDSEDREALKAALAPHRKDLQRFLQSSKGAASSGGGGEGGGFDHRRMTGGFIFSLILGALVPVLVDLVVKAAT